MHAGRDTPDPAAFLRPLIQCRSVTPADDGALTFVGDVLAGAGFAVERLTFSAPGTADVVNLFARIGDRPPHLVFAGHTDVVPPGDEARWKHPPFAGEIAGGALFGRGAVDMKGGIAAFMAAALGHLGANGGRPRGTLSLSSHRRRGRPGDQRHREAPRLGDAERQPLRRGDRRRADLPEGGSAT